MAHGELSAHELRRRLEQAEGIIAALREGDIDAVVGQKSFVLLRLREAEAQLRESEAMYRAMVDLSPDAIAVHADGKYVFVNAAAVSLFGGESAQEIVGRNVLELVHADDREAVSDRMRLAVSDGQSTPPAPFTVVRLDGCPVEVETVGTRIEFHGRPAVQVTMRDITARKRHEDALRHSMESLRLAAELAAIGTWRFDITSGSFTLSRRGRTIYGLPLEGDVTPEQVLETAHPQDLADLKRLIADMVKAPGEQSSEYRIFHPDGSERWVEIKSQTIGDSDGQPSVNIGVVIDITDQKHHEQTLLALNESLERRVFERTAEITQQAEQLRALSLQLTTTEQRERKRLARILHDHVQQLIAGAKMQVQQIKQTSDPHRMQAIAQNASDTLSEALDASRSLTVELSPPALHEKGLIGGLDWLASRMRQQQNLTVDLHADSQFEIAEEEARFLIFECARELLFNVAKHACVSEADVTIARGGDGLVTLTVRDEGTGFDPDQLSSRDAGEMTFGLFSIRERLAHLGGEMEIESSPGSGTKVTLKVPVYEEQPAAKASEVAAPRRPAEVTAWQPKQDLCRLLIVDDHNVLREGLAELLRFESDIEVVGEARDGPEAIELARKLEPDVVIMDVNLGQIDGVEATRRILSNNPEIKVIGLSMHLDRSVTKAMRDAGAAAYICKGDPTEDLIDTVRTCFKA